MLTIKELQIEDYEKVIEAKDPSCNLHCFVAIHNSTLGPALGGARFYPYPTKDDALNDVLRLAKGMTYKSSFLKSGLGGGKSVVIANPETDKSEKLLLSFAEVINHLEGNYIVAEDVGSTPEDMSIIRLKTPYVSALKSETSSGDPSRFTARGIIRGIKAVAQKLWFSSDLRHKLIVVQGLGSVGAKVAKHLFWEGADLIVNDLNENLAHEFAHLYHAKIVPPEKILEIECDIFCPCALGGILNKETIPKLNCQAVAGSANNQLNEPEDGDRLLKKGVLYAPDYIINSGGLINVVAEFDIEGYNAKIARDKVYHIYDMLLDVFERSEHEHKPTDKIADEIAEYNLQHGIGKRDVPIRFH